MTKVRYPAGIFLGNIKIEKSSLERGGAANSITPQPVGVRSLYVTWRRNTSASGTVISYS